MARSAEDRAKTMERRRTREEMRTKLEQLRRGEITPAELVKWHGEPRDVAVKEARRAFITDVVTVLERFDAGEISGEELFLLFRDLKLGEPVSQGDDLYEITEDVYWALEIFPEEIALDDLKGVVERNLVRLKDLHRRDAY
jgi:hypothetical protein